VLCYNNVTDGGRRCAGPMF